MESVFVIGLGCVAWTVIEIFRLTSSSATVAMPAGARAMGQTGPNRKPASQATHAARAPHAPRFTAWDDRGRPIVVEDLGRA